MKHARVQKKPKTANTDDITFCQIVPSLDAIVMKLIAIPNWTTERIKVMIENV